MVLQTVCFHAPWDTQGVLVNKTKYSNSLKSLTGVGCREFIKLLKPDDISRDKHWWNWWKFSIAIFYFEGKSALLFDLQGQVTMKKWELTCPLDAKQNFIDVVFNFLNFYLLHIRSLLLPYLLTTCSLLVPYLLPTGSLLIPYLFPTPSLLPPYLFPTCSILVPYVLPPCALIVPSNLIALIDLMSLIFLIIIFELFGLFSIICLIGLFHLICVIICLFYLLGLIWLRVWPIQSV